MTTQHNDRSHDSHCDVCEAEVRAKHPHVAMRLAYYAAWPALVAMISGAALMGWAAIGVTVLAPLVMFTGAFLLGPLANMAFAEPVCPTCSSPVRMYDTDVVGSPVGVRNRRESDSAAARPAVAGA